jgi:hypothetical protein
MIKGHNIANLTDLQGNSDVEVEINRYKGQDFVELRIKDKKDISPTDKWKSANIGINELYSLVLSLVGGEELDELIPDRQIKVKVYERQHKIKLLRDMKKGEIVVANFKIEIPTDINDDIKTFVGKDYKVQIKELK